MRYLPRIVGLLFALVFVVGAPVTGLAASVAAAGSCDQAVVDGAGVFKDQLPQVQAQVTALTNLGADVRVQTVTTIGSAPTLDSYERGVEQSCPSWQAADGGRKNNLIVLMVAIQERTTGLYYGSQWESALGSSWPRIQGDLMNPRFRDGDFAGGVVAGLQEIDRLVNLQLHPQSAPVPGANTQPAPAAAISGTGRTVTILVVVGVILAFTVFMFGTTIRAGRARKRLAQQRALTSQRAVVSRITSYNDEFKELDIRLELLAGQVADTDLQPLRERRAEAQRLADQAARDYGTARDSVPDPQDDRLSTVEYANIKDSYDKLLVTTTQADDLESALRGSMDELERWLKTTPEAIEKGNGALDPAARRLQAVAQAGFKTSAEQATLDRARRTLGEASAAWQEKRVGEAQRQAAEASKLVEQAVAAAEHYGARQQELLGEAERLTERVASLQAPAAAADVAATAMRATYPPSALTAIGDDEGTTADAARGAGTLASQARGFASLDRQEWDQAQGALTQAGARLDAVQRRIEAITALQATLEQAQRDAPEAMAAAQSAMEQAAAAIAQLPPDSQAALGEELEAARRRLREAGDEASLSKPDVLQVARLAADAHQAADALAARAREERERIRRDNERKAIARTIVTGMLVNAALNGGRSRGWGGRGRGGPPSFGGGGSSGWGGSGGGGGSSKW